MEKIRYEVTFTEEVLGTLSAKPALVEQFIASKRPGGVDEAEIAAIPVVEELQQSTTVFPRGANGAPILWDYQVKGFIKEALSAMARVPDSVAHDIKARIKVLDGLVFVTPRQIPLMLPAGEAMSICERPLRAQTAQGERIALARSETVPAGTKIGFEVVILDKRLASLIDEAMDYGIWKGLGQWRNSGKGRFVASRVE